MFMNPRTSRAASDIMRRLMRITLPQPTKNNHWNLSIINSFRDHLTHDIKQTKHPAIRLSRNFFSTTDKILVFRNREYHYCQFDFHSEISLLKRVKHFKNRVKFVAASFIVSLFKSNTNERSPCGI
jgi:hypothetical protein